MACARVGKERGQQMRACGDPLACALCKVDGDLGRYRLGPTGLLFSVPLQEIPDEHFRTSAGLVAA
jgi:hypothetical protein